MQRFYSFILSSFSVFLRLIEIIAAWGHGKTGAHRWSACFKLLLIHILHSWRIHPLQKHLAM